MAVEEERLLLYRPQCSVEINEKTEGVYCDTLRKTRHQSSVELTCREFIDDIDDYLSGELAPERLPHCDAHLAHCPDCVKYYRGYQETIRLSKMALDERNEKAEAYLPQELAHAILIAARRARE